MASGNGPVYMAREDPCKNTRILLFELGPPEISYAIENDPCSQEHIDALPSISLLHLQALFSDTAEAEAVLQARRLNEILENTG